MANPTSVSGWIEELKAGNRAAAQALWDRYFLQLVRQARARLGTAPRRAADEEDVALSAFDSFCRGAERGRFPRLDDRDDLWRLLIRITACKVADAINHETRQKRGGGKVRGESVWPDGREGSDDDAGIDQIVGQEPSPAFAAELADETRRFLDALGTEELRAVALMKMEGYGNQEIADHLKCSRRAVERRLKLIRGPLERQSRP